MNRPRRPLLSIFRLPLNIQFDRTRILALAVPLFLDFQFPFPNLYGRGFFRNVQDKGHGLWIAFHRLQNNAVDKVPILVPRPSLGSPGMAIL